MEKKTFWIIIVSGVIVLVVAIGAMAWRGNSAVADGVLDGFVKCLAEKNIVMYGTETCSWCRKQKEDLGSSFQYLNYVECSVETQKCVDEKITATPTWVFPDSERVEGYLTLEELSAKSSCPLPEAL